MSESPPAVDRRLIILLAAACGLTVANTYYVQPLLDTISSTFHVGPGTAGLLVTGAQLGYALGLVFLVPLGDLLDRRRLVPAVLTLTALALVAAAVAPGIGVLAAAIVVIGLTSVGAQILIPMAASMAPAEHRGQVVGSVMTGLMLGTLLSRTFAGLLGGLAGWRAVFAFAAVAMLVLAAVLSRSLPRLPRAGELSYGRLLRSVAELVRSEPVLRRRAVYGALAFALFNMFWTTLAFLLSGAPYHFGEAAIGLFALVAVPGAFAAPRAGRLADRGRSRPLTGACFATIGVGFALALAGGHALPALLAGAVVISVGVQCLHVTNQSAIYALGSAAPSRINSAYMVAYFCGGMAGSALAATVYSVRGWSGVAEAGLAVAVLGLAVWLAETGLPAARRHAITSKIQKRHEPQEASP
jgi:predicted MFS family arabinose efflux permease